MRKIVVIDDVPYAGTNQGLYRFVERIGQWELVEGTQKFGLVNAIAKDVNGDLLVGLDAENNDAAGVTGGLQRWHDGAWSRDFRETVFSLVLADGVMHAGTWDRGILRHEGTEWISILPINTEPRLNRVHAMRFTPAGILVGTVEEGVYFVRKSDRTVLEISSRTNKEVTTNLIRVIANNPVDPNSVLVGADGGPIMIVSIPMPGSGNNDSAGLSGWLRLPPGNAKRVIDAAADPFGRQWVATLDSGVQYLWVGHGWLQIDTSQSLSLAFWHGLALVGTDGHGIKAFTLPE